MECNPTPAARDEAGRGPAERAAPDGQGIGKAPGRAPRPPLDGTKGVVGLGFRTAFARSPGRPARRAAPGRRVALSVCAALAVATMGIGGVAESKGVKTTSSWYEPPSSDASVDLSSFDIAQSFETGPCRDGYRLESVWVRFRGESATTTLGGLRAALHAEVQGRPGNEVASLQTRLASKTPRNGFHHAAFLPPADAPDLDPYTTYFIVLHDPTASATDKAVVTSPSTGR